VRANLPPGVDGWGVSLNGLMGMVVIGGLIITAIYWALQRKVVPQIKSLREAKKKKKAKMSVGESFAFLAASPYIRDLAMLVVAYGISINLVEVRSFHGVHCGKDYPGYLVFALCDLWLSIVVSRHRHLYAPRNTHR
jgi:ATP/ADP translocase